MYKRNQKDKTFKRKKDYMDNTAHKYDGKPSESDKVAEIISLKALKNLPHSSYSIAADPYTAAQTPSAPYPILNRFNRAVGGNFTGLDNIDGGNVQQYANSVSSKFLEYFDYLKMELKLNYRLLPLTEPLSATRDTTKTSGVYLAKSYKGKQLINQMIQSITEAMSVLSSTTYTQMAINDYYIETDMAMGDAETETAITSGGSIVAYRYEGRAAVFFGMAMYYQLFWQELINTLNWHNSFRLKQGTAIRNAWNRESAMLNSLFGLFNKKSFLSLVDSLNLTVEGEYIDRDFLSQAAMLNVMPSRRSNSITDPVLELQTTYNHPNYFKVYARTGVGTSTLIFDDAELSYTDSDNNVVRIWDIYDQINDLLSLEATAHWARRVDATDVFQNNGSDTLRINSVISKFRTINVYINQFKTKWNDFREALDTTSRAGIVRWTKGYRPTVTKDTDAPLSRNLTIENIFQLTLSGCDKLKYDDATKRIRSYSLWNMYTGIPEYDVKQGGVFLALSTKDVTNLASLDNVIEYLPTAFNPVTTSDTYVIALSRRGIEAKIGYRTVTAASDNVFARVMPLPSQGSELLRIPYVKWSGNTTDGLIYYATDATEQAWRTARISTIIKTLTQVFGCSSVATSSSATVNNLDSDILAAYEVEFEDVTNESITYARANAPFKGTTSDAGIVGFFGVSAKQR